MPDSLLLDTSVLIKAFLTPEDLPGSWIQTLSDPSVALCVSAVSLMEIAIKTRRGREDFVVDAKAVLQWCKEEAIAVVEPTTDVLISAGELPLHHKDPFDHLIISQARHLGVPVMSTDRLFARYDVELVPLT